MYMSKRTEADDITSVYNTLRKRISQHYYVNNPHLNQKALADEFDVSRTPIIAALHMLVSEGIVDKVSNRGFFVHVPTLQEVIDLFVVRESFERVFAADVAKHATDEEINNLYAIFEPMREKIAGNEKCDSQMTYKIDIAFHSAMYSLCSNSLLKRFNDTIYVIQNSFIIGLLRQPLDTYNEHLEILDALKARDVQRAEEAARLHIANTRECLKTIGKQMESMGIDINQLWMKGV